MITYCVDAGWSNEELREEFDIVGLKVESGDQTQLGNYRYLQLQLELRGITY